MQALYDILYTFHDPVDFRWPFIYSLETCATSKEAQIILNIGTFLSRKYNTCGSVCVLTDSVPGPIQKESLFIGGKMWQQ